MDVKEKFNKGYTFKLNLDSKQVRQELNEIETQLDRIIEKYEKINKLSSRKNNCDYQPRGKYKGEKPPRTGSGIK